jgi:FMN-dependent NADH-azoreductase
MTSSRTSVTGGGHGLDRGPVRRSKVSRPGQSSDGQHCHVRPGESPESGDNASPTQSRFWLLRSGARRQLGGLVHLQSQSKSTSGRTDMTLLRIDASIQGHRSASSQLADQVLAAVISARPDEPITRRHLGRHPLPADALALAVSGANMPESDRDRGQVNALALAVAVATELSNADAAVLAFPLYNFGVSQHVKAWVDLAVAGAPYGARLLEGKPVVLVSTRGGSYGAGTPREGWDHNTPYLSRILIDVWGADLTLIEREFTLVGLNPALDEFSEIAAQMKKAAEEAALEAGTSLAARTA